MINAVKVKSISAATEFLKDAVQKNEENGKPTLIFAEDRLTFLCERAICERLGGSFLARVKTFGVYLGGSERVITKQCSVVKIGEIMLSLKDKLKCFNKSYSARLSSSAVYETIAQFSACGITPDDLLSRGTDDSVLDMKISDLAMIYGEYIKFLDENGYADESKRLSLLPQKIREDKEIRLSDVIFFAYDSFTVQAKNVISAVMESAESTVGVFLAGEEEFYTNEAFCDFLSCAEDFGGAKRSAFSIDVSPAREAAAKCLFNPETFKSDAERSENKDIKIFPCPSEDGEAALSAAIIKKYVAEGLRYKDFAVFTSSENYSRLIKKTYAEYNIPYFENVKRALSSHPMCKFILSSFKTADGGFLPRDTDEFISNCFFDFSGELKSDEYRNYLLKYARFRGGAKREIKGENLLLNDGFDREKLILCRERLLYLTSFIPRKADGKTYCDGILSLLKAAGADETLGALSAASSDVVEKDYLNQAGPSLKNMLGELKAVSAGTIYTAGEFYDILYSGLSALEIAAIPLKADAVFVGDLASAKIGDSEVVIALGLTSAVPACSRDGALITDRDIKKLRLTDINIEPLVEQVNLRSRERTALNILSFKKKLFLSYPLSSRGDEQQPSEIITYIRRRFLYSDGKKESLFPYDCAEFIPACRAAYKEKQLSLSSGKATEKFSALVRLLEREGCAVLKEGGKKRNITVAKELFHTDKYVSPTLIENFNACPYRNFLQRGLYLKEKSDAIMQNTDSGTFMHGVLLRVGKAIMDGEISDEEKCSEISLKAAEEEIEERYPAMKDEAQDLYRINALKEDARRISVAVYRKLNEDGYKISALEKRCYLKSGDLSFAGAADRVDLSDDGKKLRIIDYKTGAISDALKDYYAGIKLQPELYMLSNIGDYKGAAPAGMFYFPAKLKFTDGDETDPFEYKGFDIDDDKIFRVSSEGSEGEREKDELMRGFLRYSVTQSARSKKKLESGFISPAPYENSCDYCPYAGMCGFKGEGRSCSDIKKLTAADFARLTEEGGEKQ